MEVDLAIVDVEVTMAFVDLELNMVMEVIFNQMRNDLLSKKFRIAIDCHRSQVDVK